MANKYRKQYIFEISFLQILFFHSVISINLKVSSIPLNYSNVTFDENNNLKPLYNSLTCDRNSTALQGFSKIHLRHLYPSSSASTISFAAADNTTISNLLKLTGSPIQKYSAILTLLKELRKHFVTSLTTKKLVFEIINCTVNDLYITDATLNIHQISYHSIVNATIVTGFINNGTYLQEKAIAPSHLPVGLYMNNVISRNIVVICDKLLQIGSYNKITIKFARGFGTLDTQRNLFEGQISSGIIDCLENGPKSQQINFTLIDMFIVNATVLVHAVNYHTIVSGSITSGIMLNGSAAETNQSIINNLTLRNVNISNIAVLSAPELKNESYYINVTIKFGQGYLTTYVESLQFEGYMNYGIIDRLQPQILNREMSQVRIKNLTEIQPRMGQAGLQLPNIPGIIPPQTLNREIIMSQLQPKGIILQEMTIRRATIVIHKIGRCRGIAKGIISKGYLKCAKTSNRSCIGNLTIINLAINNVIILCPKCRKLKNGTYKKIIIQLARANNLNMNRTSIFGGNLTSGLIKCLKPPSYCKAHYLVISNATSMTLLIKGRGKKIVINENYMYDNETRYYKVACVLGNLQPRILKHKLKPIIALFQQKLPLPKFRSAGKNRRTMIINRMRINRRYLCPTYNPFYLQVGACNRKSQVAKKGDWLSNILQCQFNSTGNTPRMQHTLMLCPSIRTTCCSMPTTTSFPSSLKCTVTSRECTSTTCAITTQTCFTFTRKITCFKN